MRNVVKAICIIMTITATSAQAAEPEQTESYEINTGNHVPNYGAEQQTSRATSGGTVFLMGKPIGDGKASYVMVTAAHVFDDVAGEQAVINRSRRTPAYFFLRLKNTMVLPIIAPRPALRNIRASTAKLITKNHPTISPIVPSMAI